MNRVIKDLTEVIDFINKIKCIIGLHEFSGMAIWSTPKFDIVSYEQKCSCCGKTKTTFVNRNTGKVDKIFII